MKKELKDYLPFYLGCECICDSKLNTPLRLKIDYTLLLNDNFFKNPKPVLNPLSSITQDDFKAIIKEAYGEGNMLFKFEKNDWYVAFIDEVYDEEEFGGSYELWFESTWAEAEENDHENIIHWDKVSRNLTNASLDGDTTYCLSDIEVHSEFIRAACKLGFDCHGLIKAGLAIDNTTLKQ